MPPDDTTAAPQGDKVCTGSRVYSGVTNACTYCDANVYEHDPVFVEELGDAGDRDAAGRFCNYACLSAHIEENDLVTGAACRVDP